MKRYTIILLFQDIQSNEQNISAFNMNIHAVDRIRTCAGRAQWISSPSP